MTVPRDPGGDGDVPQQRDPATTPRREGPADGVTGAWVTLLHDGSDHDNRVERPEDDWLASEEVFSVSLPTDVRGALAEWLVELPARIHAGIEVEVSDADGHAETWDHQRLRDHVVDAIRTCLDILSRGAQHDHPPAPPHGHPVPAASGASPGIGTQQLIELAKAIGFLESVGALVDDSGRRIGIGEDDDDFDGLDALERLGADCEIMLLGRIRRRRDGTFALRWHRADRQVVRDATRFVVAAVTADDPTTLRLFPNAYLDDPDRAAGWDALARRELVERRLEALGQVDAFLDRPSCTADELQSFMRCLNDARLVFAARLDIDDTGPDPELVAEDRAAYLTYEHITFLLAQVIGALASTVG